MSLQIKTNCVRNSAGGTITGVVSLHLLNSPLEIDHLAVTLSGRAQTDIDQSTTKTPGCVFQGQRVLFATKRTLIKKPTIIAAPGPSCSWHFEFRIPHCCTAREGHAFRPFDRFNSDPEQRLPPAFASSYTKADGTHAANAAIIYELRASLLAKETRLQAVEPVHFMSTRPTEHPLHGETAAHAEVAFQSSRLTQHESTTSLQHHHRRGLRSTLSRKDLAFAAFWLVLRGSDKAIIGQSFPLHLSIRLDDSPSALSPTKPAVYLQRLQVILRAHNSIRCTGSQCFKQNGCKFIHRGDEFEDWDEELLLESCDLKTSRPETGRRRGRRGRSSLPRISSLRGIEIPTANDETTTSGLDLQQHTTIPSYVVPSFKSHIISRTYTLETSVVVRCAEKDFPVTFVNRDFELLAQDFTAPEVRGRPAALNRFGTYESDFVQ